MFLVLIISYTILLKTVFGQVSCFIIMLFNVIYNLISTLQKVRQLKKSIFMCEEMIKRKKMTSYLSQSFFPLGLKIPFLHTKGCGHDIQVRNEEIKANNFSINPFKKKSFERIMTSYRSESFFPLGSGNIISSHKRLWKFPI